MNLGNLWLVQKRFKAIQLQVLLKRVFLNRLWLCNYLRRPGRDRQLVHLHISQELYLQSILRSARHLEWERYKQILLRVTLNFSMPKILPIWPRNVASCILRTPNRQTKVSCHSPNSGKSLEWKETSIPPLVDLRATTVLTWTRTSWETWHLIRLTTDMAWPTTLSHSSFNSLIVSTLLFYDDNDAILWLASSFRKMAWCNFFWKL